MSLLPDTDRILPGAGPSLTSPRTTSRGHATDRSLHTR